MNAADSIRYTLCFLTRGDQILMLRRLRPPNQGLWNGVGGRLEEGESPRACVLREVREETGFALEEVTFCGILTWDGFETPPGGLYIYTAEAPEGEPAPCSEGLLEWKDRGWVFSDLGVVSNIHVFGPLALDGAPPQRYHFSYDRGVIARYKVLPLSASVFMG